MITGSIIFGLGVVLGLVGPVLVSKLKDLITKA